ncbi:MAG TPA: 4Fe-4S binding protein [Spirochaetota bacterium]|nr:4Fe-4S binding protein [Spirochaetota bacterium]
MIIVDTTLCTGCKRCERVCPNSAIQVNPVSKKAEINHNMCAECGMCIEECPKNAIKFLASSTRNMYNMDNNKQQYAEDSTHTIVSNNDITFPRNIPGSGRGKRYGMGKHHGKGRCQRKGLSHSYGKNRRRDY